MPKGPIIGVTGPDRGGDTAWYFTRFLLRRAGARPVRLSPARPPPGRPLDGLVLGGGADIDPALYGQEPRVSIEGDPDRDRFERLLLQEMEGTLTPVLGICRGAQLMNVAKGGDLYQDITEAEDSLIYLRTVFPRKRVKVPDGSRLSALLAEEVIRINSLHTQCVRKVGRGLAIVARDDEGLVQAVENPTHPFEIGVQWHPEYMPQIRCQRRIFEGLVRAAKDAAEA